MDFELNETERLLNDSLLRFAQREVPQDAAQDWGHAVSMGWHAAASAEDQGGFGLGLVGPMLIAESLGAALSPLSWRDSALLPALALAALADAGSAECADWLAQFLAGDLAVQTVHLAAAPGTAGQPAVMVATQGRGIGLIVLRYRQDGRAMLAIADVDADVDTDAIAADGSGRLDIDPARTRRFELTPELAARLDSAGQIATAADHLGAMQSLLDMTLDYVKTRNQFGRPLGSFQALQHRLVDMYVALEEARALTMAAAMAATEARDDASRLSAAAWERARLSGARIAEEAIQMHGGIGMTDECRVGTYVKRILHNEAARI